MYMSYHPHCKVTLKLGQGRGQHGSTANKINCVSIFHLVLTLVCPLVWTTFPNKLVHLKGPKYHQLQL